jgi:signal transduction histidine kinase
VLPLVVLAGIALWWDLQEGQARIQAERITLATAVASTSEAFLDNHLTTLRSLALAPILLNPRDEAEVSRFLTRVAAANPDWVGLGLVDPAGWNVAGTFARPGTVNIFDRPYFQQVLATGQPAISPVVIGRAAGEPTVVLAAAVDFVSGERGALIVPLQVGRLASRLGEQVTEPRAQLFLVDPEGRPIVHPDPERVGGESPLHELPEVGLVLAGGAGARIGHRDGVETLVAYTTVPTYGWGVLVTEPTASAFEQVRNELLERVLVVGLAVLLVVGIGWHLGGQLSLVYEGLVAARHQAEFGRAEAEQAKSAAEAERRRATFLAEASRELASSLEYETTLRQVARLAVPTIADWCIIDVLEREQETRRVEVIQADPAKEELAAALRRFSPDLNQPNGIGKALRMGQSELVEALSEDFLRQASRDEEHFALATQVGYRSVMFVPLQARSRTLGVMTFATAESGRRYTRQDLELAEELARRAALAVDNARLYTQAQEAIRARDEFLSIASHELRTPITVIKGFAELLLRAESRGQLQPDRLQHALHRINDTSLHITAMVNDLLDVSRLRTGQLPLRPQQLDLVAVCRELVERYAEQLSEQHPIRFQSTVAAWQIEADPGRLEQVLTNLIENAAKYSPEGGAIFVSLDATSAGTVLRVRDQGIGIPAGAEESIFEPFGRAENATTRQLPGLGLGLHICRGIVERHGGRIWVESAGDGLGSTFNVWLPSTAQPGDGRAP